MELVSAWGDYVSESSFIEDKRVEFKSRRIANNIATMPRGRVIDEDTLFECVKRVQILNKRLSGKQSD